MDRCWICDQSATATRKGSADAYQVTCVRCGAYQITGSLAASEGPIPKSERYRLSHWCSQRALDHRTPPTFDSQSVKAIAAELPLPKAHAKADVLLMSLGKAYPKPGQPLQLDWGRDYPLACATDGSEMKFHFRTLKARGFVEGEGNAQITWAGWDRISQLEHQPFTSTYAFLAFRFSQEFLENWSAGFGAAIRRAGFEPLLANYPEHNERIDAKIISEIKRSRFVVADVTGANTGVYFEAGYALGLGRPVIWTCQADSMKDMHFDTKQYNHILWKSYSDLQEQLYVRIVATI